MHGIGEAILWWVPNTFSKEIRGTWPSSCTASSAANIESQHYAGLGCGGADPDPFLLIQSLLVRGPIHYYADVRCR